MGFLDLFGTSLILGVVERISKGIKETNSYKYFATDDPIMIREYKDFECTLIASAIAVLALDLDLKDPKHKKDIQTVYVGKCAGFLRKIISKEYISYKLELDKRHAELFYKGSMEALFVHKLHLIFEEYLEEIQKAFKTKSPYYFWEYGTKIIDEITGKEIFGEQRLFEFIWDLLLARATLDFDNYSDIENSITYKVFLDLTEEENKLLYAFVKDLELLKNN
jgi:hypothetical protein